MKTNLAFIENWQEKQYQQLITGKLAPNEDARMRVR